MANTAQSLDRVQFSNSGTPGTGTITVNAAIAGYRTPAGAGAVNDAIYKMLILYGSDWEVSRGVYNSGAATMTRVLKASSTGSLLNLAGAAIIAFLEDADDENGQRILSEPQGRLTSSTGVPVLTSNVLAATSIYYTPYQGNRGIFPDKDGLGLTMREFSELSQALSDNTKSPAAAVAWRVYDIWGWDDAGTLRATRGPGWTDGGRTFTVTIASPGVFTLAAHGFWAGQPVIPTTSGALPTGLTTGTIYYVVGGTSLTTNTFQLSATIGGAAINTTGSQSGTHTMTNYVQSRGTGAGTEEHDTTTYPGWRVNKYAITNGPGAAKGFYLGTILTNASIQLDMYVGRTIAAGGGGNILCVWNAYQEEEMVSVNAESTTYNYTTATYRLKNNSYANRTVFVQGLNTRPAKFKGITRSTNGSNTEWLTGAALNGSAVTEPNIVLGWQSDAGGNNSARVGMVVNQEAYVQGMNAFCPMEWSTATGTTTWTADAVWPHSSTSTIILG